MFQAVESGYGVMKILVIGPSETRARGGMSAVIREIRESELLKDEFEIDTFASYIDGPLAVRLVYTFWGCLRFMLCSRRYDLFHLHTAERGSTFRKHFYLWWAKRTGRKVIVHIHGAEYLTFYDGLGSLGRRVVDRFLQRADLVLALSESWKRELEARFCIDTCRTLYNGVDTAKFRAAVTDVSACRHSFLMLGRLGSRKGVYDLIDAVEIACRKNPELTVCIAGDGEVDKVRALVAEKGLDRHISVPGWIGETQKLKYLKKAAVLVLPSYYEGLPMAVLEGMAAGKAIISTTVGAIPEVIGEENGILLEPGDVEGLAEAMLACSGNVEALQKMSAENRRKAEETFGVRRMHERLGAYYKMVGDV